MNFIMPYLVAAALVSLIVVRILGARKTGASAVKFEVIYLLIYAFFGGVLFSFFLTNPGMGIVALLVLATFTGGFILRLIPLFRLIRKVEDETRIKN